MRRQILITVAASTLLVLLAFLIPLAWLVRASAADRASSEATLGVQPLTSTVGLLGAGLPGVVADTQEQLGEPVTVFLGNGQVVGTPRPVTDSVRLARGDVANRVAPRAFSANLPDGGREILIPVVGLDAGTAVVRVEVPAAKLTDGVATAWWVLGGLGVSLLALALLVADRLARSYLGPVLALTDTAALLGAGELSARVVPSGPPEVTAAGRALNRLGSRIGDLLTAEREAAADLSHRLRTPVAALRLDVDGLSDPEDRERMARDVAELSRAIDQLIAEARRPIREGMVPACDATAVVGARVAFWRVLAEDTDRELTVSVAPGPLRVRLVPGDLADAVDALLGNVFAHTPDGTSFRVVLSSRAGGGARLVIEDTGPGLPGGDVMSRGESGAGSTGLGLDIVRRSAEASGGSLALVPAHDGGTRVVLELGPPS